MKLLKCKNCKQKTEHKQCGFSGKYVILIGFVFLFLIGLVSAVDIRVTDNNAFDDIVSNTNITINTYNQTWLEFDGDGDYVKTNSIVDINLNKNFSIFIDFNVVNNMTGSSQVLFSSSKDNAIGSFTPNRVGVSIGATGWLGMQFYNGTGGVGGIGNIIDNSTRYKLLWSYVENSTTNFSVSSNCYLNDISCVGVPGATTSNAFQTMIGAKEVTPDTFFNGSIYQVAVINRSLTSDESFIASRENMKWLVNSSINLTAGRIYPVQNQSGTIYTQGGEFIYRSMDGGATWDTVLTADSQLSTLMIMSNNVMITSEVYNNTIWVSQSINDTNWTSIKGTFSCFNQTGDNEFGYIWHGTEDNSGNFYIGEYSISDSFGENCSYIYKSSNNGLDWSLVYNSTSYGIPARHMHIVKADSDTGYIYAAQGDGANEAALLRSVDEGVTWTTLQDGTLFAQYITMEFNDGCGFFGTDAGDSGNKIVRSCDDGVTLTDSLVLPTNENGNLWASSIDDLGRIYFSTITGVTWANNSGIWVTDNNGLNWNRVLRIYNETDSRGYNYLSNFVNGVAYTSTNLLNVPLYRINLVNVTYLLNYKLNENTGTTAYDVSGNANNGTITGATWNNDGILIETFINNPFLNLFGSLLQFPSDLLWNLFVLDSKPTVDFILLNNTGVVSYNISTYNNTNSLIYFSNGSVKCTNVADCDNNQNITLSLSNWTYVLDEYNPKVGITRDNDPIWNGVTNKANNTLEENITFTISNLINADLTYSNGTILTHLTGSQIVFLQPTETFSILQRSIANQGLRTSCIDIQQGFLTFSSLLPIIFVIFLAVIVLGFFIGNMSEGNDKGRIQFNIKDLDDIQIMSIFITIILVGLILIVGLMVVGSVGGC